VQRIVSSMLLVLFASACRQQAKSVIPWAWERREDLRFVHGQVAYLARTIILRGGTIEVRPRMQPLRVSAASTVIPVVRIETHNASLDVRQRMAVVEAIDGIHAQHVQIDFDATVSERAFYADVIRGLHPTVPHIDITALASWCSDDRWLSGLPIDDAIPMLFQMGPDDHVVRSRLNRGDDFRDPICRSSAGIALNETPPRIPAGRRLYVFDSHRWSRRDWQRAVEIARR
jgi:hypothetical protein